MTGGLHHIIFQINEEINTAFLNHAVFNGFALYGLAGSAYRENAVEMMPVIFDKAGDGKYVGINDAHPAILYHKVSGFRPGVDRSKSYGNSWLRLNTYNMSMLVFHDRKKTGLEADEVALLIQERFPDRLEIRPYEKVSLAISNIILDTLRVFRSEYSGFQYFPAPYQALTQIDYTIETAFKWECFKPNQYVINA